MLRMEELDEALKEVGTLLHLTLPSFEQVLGEEQGKTCDVSRKWILGTRAEIPNPGLIFLAMVETW